MITKIFSYISRTIPFFIHTPRAETFGNCGEELLFGLLRAQQENKKILFLYPKNLIFKKVVANQKLFHICSPYTVKNYVVSYVGGWLFTLVIALMWVRTRPSLGGVRRIFRWIRPKKATRSTFDFFHMSPTIGRSTLWKTNGIKDFSWKTVDEQNWGQQYNKYVPPTLTASDCRRAERMTLQMGIRPTDWFACVHVRESGYYNDSEINRNASIRNYVEAIQVITSAGGWVVRLGDPSMVPLDPMERVIDYPHTPFKNELMDIYFLSHCRLLLGINSGPYDVATLFKRPVLLVNSPEWSIGFPKRKGDLAITKHIFSVSRGRFLSISEILTEPYSIQVFSTLPDEYLMVENTSEEIRQLVEEFLGKNEDQEYSDLQNAFNAGRRKQIHTWLNQESSLNQLSETVLVEKYRIAAHCEITAGTLGKTYLEQNWLVDNLPLSALKPPVL